MPTVSWPSVLFARELATQLEGTGVTCYAAHPGEVCLSGCSASFLFPRSHPRPFPAPPASPEPQNLRAGRKPGQGRGLFLADLEARLSLSEACLTPQTQMLKAG